MNVLTGQEWHGGFDCTTAFNVNNNTIGSKVANTIPFKRKLSALVSFLARRESCFLQDQIVVSGEGGNLLLSSKY